MMFRICDLKEKEFCSYDMHFVKLPTHHLHHLSRRRGDHHQYPKIILLHDGGSCDHYDLHGDSKDLKTCL